ncbi:T9SS type A sorting domain-containing protein [Rubrivirga sp. IMCC43871]|uniref:T9SS type A sorting domain-containing protein n=1 Tax=Rubrivirga sp. IMCC43871 TaxID=3391575 RepID=UPI00398FAD63
MRALLVASLVVLLAGASTAQSTFVVTTTEPTGPGSLQSAIFAANQSRNGSGPDRIEFALSGAPGPFVIRPTSPLPAITEAVVIDGLSQPGADCSSWPATLLIVLDGQNAGSEADGLQFTDGGGSTVRGLVVGRFANDGFDIEGDGGNTFECNYVGTDVRGTAARPNGDDGFDVASPDNVIGGRTPSARNLISGNAEDGVDVDGFGVGSARGNRIQGNYIGVATDGASPLGNGDDGVETQFGADDTLVGGDGEGEGNVIAYSGDHGIQTEQADRITILGNAIYANGTLGIDLDNDGVTPNDNDSFTSRQNFPELGAATTFSNADGTVVTGSLPSQADATFWVELFASDALDTSGFGEGERFLGATDVTTDGSGNAAFEITVVGLPAGAFVTATATNTDGETSEFGRGVAVTTRNNVGSEPETGAELTVAVAPNPSASGGTIQIEVGAGPVAEVAVFDALGRAVHEVHRLGRGRHVVAVPLLPAGAYVVRVVAGAHVQTARLTIAR